MLSVISYSGQIFIVPHPLPPPPPNDLLRRSSLKLSSAELYVVQVVFIMAQENDPKQPLSGYWGEEILRGDSEEDTLDKSSLIVFELSNGNKYSNTSINSKIVGAFTSQMTQNNNVTRAYHHTFSCLPSPSPFCLTMTSLREQYIVPPHNNKYDSYRPISKEISLLHSISLS